MEKERGLIIVVGSSKKKQGVNTFTASTGSPDPTTTDERTRPFGAHSNLPLWSLLKLAIC